MEVETTLRIIESSRVMSGMTKGEGNGRGKEMTGKAGWGNRVEISEERAFCPENAFLSEAPVRYGLREVCASESSREVLLAVFSVSCAADSDQGEITVGEFLATSSATLRGVVSPVRGLT